MNALWPSAVESHSINKIMRTIWKSVFGCCDVCCMHPITTNNRNHRNRFNPWTRDNNNNTHNDGMERWLISTVTGYAHIPIESRTLTFKLQRQLTLRKKIYSNVDHTLDAARFENDFLMKKQLSREEWMEWASHIDNDNAFNSEVQSSSIQRAHIVQIILHCSQLTAMFVPH